LYKFVLSPSSIHSIRKDNSAAFWGNGFVREYDLHFLHPSDR
jgi:hypothetical protein